MQQSTCLSRRKFILYGGTIAMALTAPQLASARVIKSHNGLKQAQPQRALVVWYSQTGHTDRYARLIAHKLTKQGLVVDTHRLRFGDIPNVAGYDLIIAGTPVQYLDVPKNVGEWINKIAPITGVGVASFVSYGGHGDGQHNTAISLLGSLVDKGGVPLGLDTFGNMSTYAPTWSMGNEKRILKFRHKPDQATYAQVSKYAEAILDQYKSGQGIEAKSQSSFSGLFKGDPSRAMAKATLGKHTIDTKLCIHCGTCVNTCPEGAINLAIPRIDPQRCILCFGCVNNCPTGAHTMTVLGKPIYGFPEFLRRNGIKIMEPPLNEA